ncbi:MAG: leucine-rich repeat protein [Clostridia bacterium]|nr:leucine-rich repeat protein [Clostridia bacterium]
MSSVGLLIENGVLVKYEGGGECVVSEEIVEIGEGAFSDSEITSIVLPEGVVKIGRNAFKNCKMLTEVGIPSTLEKLSSGSFYGCESLESIDLSTVKYIPDRSFMNCESLKDILFCAELDSIGNNAFANCTSLVNVDLPLCIKSIGDSAFYACVNLLDITICAETEYIGSNVFLRDDDLVVSVIGLEPNEDWDEEWDFGGCTIVYIDDNLSRENLCGNCDACGKSCEDSAEPVVQTEVAEDIECDQPESQAHPECETACETDCAEPESQAQPECESTGDADTNECEGECTKESDTADAESCAAVDEGEAVNDGLTCVGQDINDTCADTEHDGDKKGEESPAEESDEAKVFQTDADEEKVITEKETGTGTDEERVITEKETETETESDIYKETDAVEYGAPTKAQDVAIEFEDEDEVGEPRFEIVEGVLTAYYGESKRVVIPEEVTEIDDYVFFGHKEIQEVGFPTGLARIGKQAFYECELIKSVVLPDSLMSIGAMAFSACKSLTSVYIPKDVVSIDFNAFSFCDKLTIYCGVEKEPFGWHPDWNLFMRPVVWGYVPDKDGATNAD